jgi:molecular chaperone DnaK (HSP70)
MGSLLTPDQKAKLGLRPDELFSNDFVPRAHLDEIDRLQLEPDRKQLIKRCIAPSDAMKQALRDAGATVDES